MNLFDKYLSYIEKKYGTFRYLCDKYSLEYAYIQSEKNTLWIENENGFALIFQDQNFPSSICFFGYLEILGNASDFLSEVKKLARDRGCETLIGPVNLSFWNQYRFSSDSLNMLLPGEYKTNPTYHEFLLQNGFQISESFLTVYRDGTNPFTHYEIDDSVEIVEVKGEESMRAIFELSSTIFDTTPKISYEEFLVYMRAYRDLYSESSHIFLMKKDQKNIGFLSSFFGDDFFVIKTFGIVKEYRRKGYGNMILDNVFQYYFRQGKKKSYGLYMRKSGDVMEMSHGGGSIFREYFTYSASLSCNS